jgi:hypothetical protein
MTEGKICGKEYMKELLETEQTPSESEGTSSYYTNPGKGRSPRKKTKKGFEKSNGTNFSKSADDLEKDSMMPEVGGLGGIESSSELIEKFGNFQFLKRNSIKKREFWKQKKLESKKEKFQRGEMLGTALDRSLVGLSSNRTVVPAGDGMFSAPGPAMPYRSNRNVPNTSGFGAFLETSVRKVGLASGGNSGQQANPFGSFMQIKFVAKPTDEDTELSGVLSPMSRAMSPMSGGGQIGKFGLMSPKYSNLAKPNTEKILPENYERLANEKLES